MLNAAFIGFGRMGITHFSILNTSPDVRVVAVSEPSSVMQSVLKKYLSIKVYSDYQDMLNNENVDLVVISTPPDSHAEIINFMADKKIAFFVEKPLSLSANESYQIVQKLSGSGIVNQVGYVNRFLETFAYVKDLLEQGVIGRVKTFSTEMYSATVTKDASGGWRSKKKAGGGCSYEMASHAIDLAVYLFGEPSAVKGSVLQGIYSTAVDDLVSSTLVYPDGCTGRLVVNWSDASYRKPGNTITINGLKGKIIVSKYTVKIYLIDELPKNNLKKGWNTIYLTDISANVPFYLRGNEFTLQLYDFIDAVKNNREARSTCHSAMITDGILEAIARDAERDSQEGIVFSSEAPAAQEKNTSGSFFSKLFSK